MPDNQKHEIMDTVRRMAKELPDPNVALLAIDPAAKKTAVLLHVAGEGWRLSTNRCAGKSSRPRKWDGIKASDWEVLVQLTGQLVRVCKYRDLYTHVVVCSK